MAVVDPEALAQVLASIDVRMGAARRVELASGSSLPVPGGTVTLVYVAEGVVRGHPPLVAGCRIDVDRATDRISVTDRGDRAQLVAGDALIAHRDRGLLLQPESERTSLVVFELELSEGRRSLGAALPDLVTVRDFAALEPAAAALAATMGIVEPESCALRSGNLVICRMMATTVLMSLIRAWAENGSAPEGWPTAGKDPFLERVVEAIHDEPGRDWTVGVLASVGAMSRSVFAERFRAALGSTPASYVTEVRMNTAKQMLESGHSVSTVARELGYASDEGFSRAFRRSVGVTPSSWRASRRTLAVT